MNTEWMGRNCKECGFEISDLCRRFPPDNWKFENTVMAIYPTVNNYTAACAEFKEFIGKD